MGLNRILLSLLFLFLILSGATMANETAYSQETNIPTVGYFPVSFPRDPTEVNIYLEHLLLGQIIEPLVESAPDGSIVPAVASHWTISNDSKEVHFFIRNGIKFSNGTLVKAADVKYSLERHIQSKNSQSKEYLSRITEMNVLSDSEIVFKLDSPYVAIFKALSRDQLGIIPSGWKFDPKSNDPFIGTGPYRAIRDASGWKLQLNAEYREATKVNVPSWKILFDNPKGLEWKDRETADLVPFATDDLIANVSKTKDWTNKSHLVEDVTHFFQTTIWWYPHGSSYSSKERRLLAANAMSEFIKLHVKKRSLTASTGVIPEGIQGHLSQLPELQRGDSSKVENRNFTIAVASRVYRELSSAEEIKQIEDEFKIRLNVTELNPIDLPNLPAKKPDLIVLSYAGGFQDPEGILTIITASLCSSLKSIFQDYYQEYLEASQQLDWNKRAELYQTFNRHMVESGRVVPGWKHRGVRLRNPQLTANPNSLRYMAKLKDYQFIQK